MRGDSGGLELGEAMKKRYRKEDEALGCLDAFCSGLSHVHRGEFGWAWHDFFIAGIGDSFPGTIALGVTPHPADGEQLRIPEWHSK